MNTETNLNPASLVDVAAVYPDDSQGSDVLPGSALHEASVIKVTDEIRKGIKALYSPEDTVEIRCFDQAGVRRVGRYKFGWDLARALEKEDILGRDCYYVLNPTGLPPIPIASGQTGTRETDVPWRRHFLLDFDPIREHKIATDEQHRSALEQASQAYSFMKTEGCSDIVTASSGNGVHLLVQVDLPNDGPSKDLIRRIQRVVSKRFSTQQVEVECFPDAARLVRAYGTKNKKGTETNELKWRRSRIL